MAAGAGFGHILRETYRPARDSLNMACIDGQDLAERMFSPAPILTRVFGE
jgi:hypothetical protein